MSLEQRIEKLEAMLGYVLDVKLPDGGTIGDYVVKMARDDIHNTIEDGWYFFREKPTQWWRATQVKGGKVFARWISEGGPMEMRYCDGEWYGPMPADHGDLKRAMRDASWCLLRDAVGHYEPTFRTSDGGNVTLEVR